jgi:plasmid stability protein
MSKTVNLRDLPEELVRRAKACAALHGQTLKDFVVDAIRAAVEKDIPATTANVGVFFSRPARRTRAK